MRVVKPWHRLLREAVEALSLETFQTRLDSALKNLIQLKMSLLTAGGLGYMASKSRFQPKGFCDSMNSCALPHKYLDLSGCIGSSQIA